MKKPPLLSLKKSRNRLQPHTVTRLLPNIATVMATCSGLTAIRFALLENYHLAVTAVIIAALLDAMDGRLARLLGATSDFGAELDSLSDFVSFGVAPAIVLYILTLHEWRGFGWGVSLFFAVCMSLRLARFNVMSRSPVPSRWSAKFFTGVPAPAAAMIGLFPLIIYLATNIEIFKHPFFHVFFLIFSGVLMISRLPTFSFKAFDIPSGWVLPFLVIVGLIVAALFNAPWETISLCVLAYIISIPLGSVAFRRLTTQMTVKDEKVDDTVLVLDKK